MKPANRWKEKGQGKRNKVQKCQKQSRSYLTENQTGGKKETEWKIKDFTIKKAPALNPFLYRVPYQNLYFCLFSKKVQYLEQCQCKGRAHQKKSV